MQSKRGLKAGRPEKIDKQRRKVIKLMGAAGAGAIASPWMFQSSRAASKTIKIGMITPETGPIAAFGEAFEMGRRGRQQGSGRRHHGRRPKVPGRNPQPRQPIKPEPRVGSGGAAHQQRQGRHHGRLVDRPTRPIRWPINASSPACLASPRTIRGRLRSSAARAIPRRASSGRTTSSGASTWWPTCSPRCGCRCRPTKSWASC